jgi:hypothetical protein
MRTIYIWTLLASWAVAGACGSDSNPASTVLDIDVDATRSGTVDPSVITDEITFEGEYDMHFYSFVAPEAGTYEVDLSGDAPVQVTQCGPGDVGEYGCLCNIVTPTCCTVEEVEGACNFALLSLAAGQEVLLVIGTYGSEPASYTVGVTGPI